MTIIDEKDAREAFSGENTTSRTGAPPRTGRVEGGANDSDPIERANGMGIAGIKFPAPPDSDTTISFKVAASLEEVEANDFVFLLQADGQEILTSESITTSAGRGWFPAELAPWKYFKVVLNTAQTANYEFRIVDKS